MNRCEDATLATPVGDMTLANVACSIDLDSSPQPVVTQTACGKAIIVGEHAVVYGARAIAMPLLSMRVSIRVRQRTVSQSIRLLLDGKSVSDHLGGVVEDAARLLDMKPMGLDIEGNSGVLIGAGLGSSASLCIVMLRALALVSGKNLTTDRLAALGNQLESRFHGNPSGLDTAVVAHEHVITFRRGEGGKALALRPSGGDGSAWPFVLIDSGLRSSTVAMINVARPYFTGVNSDRRVSRFDALAENVEQAMAFGQQPTVGEAMTETHALLREAGVVNQRLDDIWQECKAVGVLGAKVTGAGGGGCLLALLDPQKAEQQVRELKRTLGPRHVYSVRING